MSKRVPHADKLLDPPRGLADHLPDDLRIAERAAGLERVGHVVLEAVLRIDHARDAALGEGAVRNSAGRPW